MTGGSLPLDNKTVLLVLLNVIFGKRIELSILAKLASYSHITNKHV